VADLHLDDIDSLIHLDVSRVKVHSYAWETRCIERPVHIPWPIVWMLSRTHPKHRYHSKPPALADMAPLIRQFMNKLQWRLALEGDFLPPFKLRAKRPTPQCTLPPTPAMGSFIYNLFIVCVVCHGEGLGDPSVGTNVRHPYAHSVAI
jgi:hypothetical protein